MNSLQLTAAIAVLSVSAAFAAPRFPNQEFGMCVTYDARNQTLGCRSRRSEVADQFGNLVGCRPNTVRVITSVNVVRCPEPVQL